MKQQAYEALDAVITVGAESTGVFPVAVQLKGPSGKDLKHSAAIYGYLSKNADGSTICVDATDTDALGIVSAGDGLYVECLADLAGYFISEDDGDIDIEVDVINTKTAYLVLVMPNGRLVISSAMLATG